MHLYLLYLLFSFSMLSLWWLQACALVLERFAHAHEFLDVAAECGDAEGHQQ